MRSSGGGSRLKFKIVLEYGLVMKYAVKIVNGKVSLTMSKQRPF